MDNKRFVIFLLFSMTFIIVWTKFVAPPPEIPARDEPAEAVVDGDNKNEANADADSVGADPDLADSPPPMHPDATVELGSLDPADGFAVKAVLNARGAAVETVQLTSPQFRDLKDQTQQAVVVGTNSTEDRSLTTSMEFLDKELKKHGTSLSTINWAVAQNVDDKSLQTVTFNLEFQSLLLQKTYRLRRVDVEAEERAAAYSDDGGAYIIDVEFQITNNASEARNIVYELNGPVGVLLENREHTRKYRDIKAEFQSDSGAVTLTPTQLEKKIAALKEEHSGLSDVELNGKLREKESWTEPIRYAGVDVQFFAAILQPQDPDLPEGDDAEKGDAAAKQADPAQRVERNWVDRVYPVMIEADAEDRSMSDISFRMRSKQFELGSLASNNSVTHRYNFFVGPKRRNLLDPPPLVASRVLDYGSFFGFVARFMHSVLEYLYSIGMPFSLAIISLTILVRGCLFPISRKQAISAARMKELQPKIQELKEKFGDDREKMAKAQMELWRKHGVNPMAGCLPLLLQMPVFIGLYTALNTAVDLRLSRFLWIDNLAQPDALFRLPFEIPFLGMDFNLLPCMTVVLFLVQQKMFMPPATDEQQAMQYKMMNFMTLAFGFMFWHQPAGLCLYFIASSLWGIAERTLLAKTTPKPQVVVVDPKDNNKKKGKTATTAPSEPRKPGFFERLMDAAQQARENAEKNRPNPNKGKKSN